jgi:hypothetical protein
MRGSVVNRGNTWSYVVDIGRDPMSGRRRQTWKGGFPTKREAERGLGRAFAAVGAAQVPDAGRLTVGTYFDQWLAGHAPSLKPVDGEELPRGRLPARRAANSRGVGTRSAWSGPIKA